MNPRKMAAASEHAYYSQSQRLDKVSKLTLFAAMVVFIVAVATNGTVRAVYELLKRQGINLTEAQKESLRRQFTWTMVNMGCTVLGKSLVSTVFFADGGL